VPGVSLRVMIVVEQSEVFEIVIVLELEADYCSSDPSSIGTMPLEQMLGWALKLVRLGTRRQGR